MAHVVDTLSTEPVNPTVERWRLVPGYPSYRVSDLGRVQSRRGRNGMLMPDGQWYMMKPMIDGHGYEQVRLIRGRRGKGDVKRFGVHQLVLLAFVGPCPAGQVVRHVLTNDPRDNQLENLAYGTTKENHADKWRHGTACLKRGPYKKRGTPHVTEPAPQMPLDLFAGVE
jgi:hypothetical protein